MTLAAKYESVDQIPEALAEHYVERDGAWVLDCPEHAQRVGELNGEAKKHRLRAEAAETKLAGYKDIDPERVAGLAEELRLSRANEREVLVGAKLTVALMQARATPEGLELLTDKLGQRISVETRDGRRQVRILAADGKTPTDATLADLMKEARDAWPGCFLGHGNGGSGAPTRGRVPGNGGDTITRQEFDALGPAAKAGKVSAGVQVVDA